MNDTKDCRPPSDDEIERRLDGGFELHDGTTVGGPSRLHCIVHGFGCNTLWLAAIRKPEQGAVLTPEPSSAPADEIDARFDALWEVISPARIQDRQFARVWYRYGATEEANAARSDGGEADEREALDELAAHLRDEEANERSEAALEEENGYARRSAQHTRQADEFARWNAALARLRVVGRDA